MRPCSHSLFIATSLSFQTPSSWNFPCPLDSDEERSLYRVLDDRRIELERLKDRRFDIISLFLSSIFAHVPPSRKVTFPTTWDDYHKLDEDYKTMLTRLCNNAQVLAKEAPISQPSSEKGSSEEGHSDRTKTSF
ncbi:hypothetical protein CC78DRAFT_545535 [Lojkania enalia]|uniref:Uncharacterized protein n=1 Tax=Lojkania enalia TaxID=147567 RepID=A0A9P4K650_9PLEO|nr:hypothetical protein CC78DRAFT_545535 [Didymosphaeria enalia]